MSEITREITRVGVVGCGLDGFGHRRGVRRAGLDVMVREIDAAAAERGPDAAHRRRSTAASARASSTEDERDAALARLRFTTDLGDLADRQLVIEAVIEDEALKTEVFPTLDKVVTDAHAILATQHELDPDHEARHRHPAPRARASASTSSTRCRC